MREIDASEITDTVARLCIDACHELPADVIQAFHDAERKEISPFGKSVLIKLIDNDRIAREQKVPYCHDTGLTIVYAEVGQEIHIAGGDYPTAAISMPSRSPSTGNSYSRRLE